MDYLTPQNQPTVYEIPDPHQLANDSMFNKTKSKLIGKSIIIPVTKSSHSSISDGRSHRQYTESALVHHGRYSKTFRVMDRNHKSDSVEYAIKTDCDHSQNQRNGSLLREGHILSALLRTGSACKYIPRYYEMWSMWTEDTNLYVVLECCDQTLSSLRNAQPINEPDIYGLCCIFPGH